MTKRYVFSDRGLDLDDPLTIALSVFLLEASHEWLSDPCPPGASSADLWSDKWSEW